jgi:integrase
MYSRADATARAYQQDFDRFVNWANDRELDFLPATPETVALFIADLDRRKKAPATIRRMLASISQAHKAFDLESPTSGAKVTEVLRGILRRRGTAQKQAKPLLAKQLQRIARTIPRDVVGTRDRAILLLGWAGALRRSEICALSVEDLERTDEGLILTIRRSKGDPYGKGQKVALPALDSEFCPCTATRKWLELAQIETGFVFCGIGLIGKNTFSARIDNTRSLDTRMVSLIVKKYVKTIGLNADHYSAHSLRSGWVTSAAAINAPNHVMLRHTRHKSVKTLLGYVRDGQLFTDSPLPLLLSV